MVNIMCRGGGGGGGGERGGTRIQIISQGGTSNVGRGEEQVHVHISFLPGSITLLGFHASGMLRTRL